MLGLEGALAVVWTVFGRVQGVIDHRAAIGGKPCMFLGRAEFEDGRPAL